ncbi:MAG: TIGR04282 family arsenosugar biosynthesis glycosyltransferase [Elusimicrobia bacterium]|nr:TIGR04282 family arsenosugar biosynthesis glycosyltransferase [Elusimicrobiota bacterium]
MLVFLKDPVPGRVKTRLIGALGPRGAARAYAAILEETRGTLSRLRGIRIVWVRERLQGEGDLGARLARAFSRAFRAGARRVCVIGTDSPAISVRLLERAFAALRRADVVLGPSEDGGYYLLGLNAGEPRLFRSVPWSSPRVLAVTRRRARVLGLKTRLLPRLYDVDHPADLVRWLRG